MKASQRLHKSFTAWTIVVFFLCALLATPVTLGYFPNRSWEVVGETLGVYSDSEIVLFGDSLMSEINMANHFGLNPYKNRAVAGSLATTSHDRMEKAVSEKTKMVFILIGTNDLGMGIPSSDIAQAINRLGKFFKTKGVQVVLCSILPARGASQANRPPETLEELNGIIDRYCATHGYHYLDLNTAFKDDTDSLRSNYTSDGLHLNSRGRTVLAATISRTANTLTQLHE